MRAKKYDNGGKTKKKESGTKKVILPFKKPAQSDTLERSPEQVRENAGNQAVYRRPKLSFEKRQAEAVKERARNKRTNATDRMSGSVRKYLDANLDETNLRDKDGSPLSGGSKAPISDPKKIATKTPSKSLKKSTAVIPVPSKKDLKKGKRKNRN